MQATHKNTTDDGLRPQLESQPWKRAAISRSYAYALMAAQPPAFPRPVKIGKASRFVTAEIDAWIASHVTERDSLRRGAAAA